MLLNFPPPANWADFEILVKRWLELTCVENSVRLHGRPGQAQKGVDLYGELLTGGEIAVQCKKLQAGSTLSKAEIKKEADDARNLPVRRKLTTFVIATTLPEDTALHRAVVELDQSGAYSFNVTYWSWTHFNDVLNRCNGLVQDCYKEYASAFGVDRMLDDLCALRTAFDRPAFTDDFAHEQSCDDFIEGLSDTIFFLKSGLLRDRKTRALISSTISQNLLPSGENKSMRGSLLRLVNELRTSAIKDSTKNQLHRDAAPLYNAKRMAIIETLNRLLVSKSIARVDPNY